MSKPNRAATGAPAESTKWMESAVIVSSVRPLEKWSCTSVCTLTSVASSRGLTWTTLVECPGRAVDHPRVHVIQMAPPRTATPSAARSHLLALAPRKLPEDLRAGLTTVLPRWMTSAIPDPRRAGYAL